MKKSIAIAVLFMAFVSSCGNKTENYHKPVDSTGVDSSATVTDTTSTDTVVVVLE